MKNPRYLNPSFSGFTSKDIISFNTISSSIYHLASRNNDFCGLKDIPVDLHNRSSTSLQTFHFVMVPFPNNNTSSTNSKCVILIPFSTKIPSILFFTTCSCMDLLKPSTTSRNSNGDNVHPCLNPLVLLKKLEGLPFIKTTKFFVETHPIIQSVASKLKPTCSKNNLRKTQSTRS